MRQSFWLTRLSNLILEPLASHTTVGSQIEASFPSRLRDARQAVRKGLMTKLEFEEYTGVQY